MKASVRNLKNTLLPCTGLLGMPKSFQDINWITLFIAATTLLMIVNTKVFSSDLSEKESWSTHPEFGDYCSGVIAVLPMDNFSLEPDVERFLYTEVYRSLKAKGYMTISAQKVDRVMNSLGIQTPGQISGIATSRLGQLLNCDAILSGRIEQSASIHQGVYDAVVVSCSLNLRDCKTGTTLWQTQQWRAAHRQWQVDPINIFINFLGHKNASRKERVAWLVHEMLKTLPIGPVKLETGDLLQQAMEVRINVK